MESETCREQVQGLLQEVHVLLAASRHIVILPLIFHG